MLELELKLKVPPERFSAVPAGTRMDPEPPPPPPNCRVPACRSTSPALLKAIPFTTLRVPAVGFRKMPALSKRLTPPFQANEPEPRASNNAPKRLVITPELKTMLPEPVHF